MTRVILVIFVLFLLFSMSGDIKNLTENSLAQRLSGEKTQEVVVKNILSGDSFRTTEGQVIRLSGITSVAGSRSARKAARVGLWRLIRPGTAVKLYLEGYDTKGRTLARVERTDGLKVQVVLVQQKLARPYTPPGVEHEWAEEIALAESLPAVYNHKHT